ncbi:hypothetical protein SAMN05421578_109169 [Paenibacillus macquariensis]|uniref:Uncharacterized protein n=1 Tax=Paenibacillus macquariensis TaxID=948756 RepID=A0ABY1K4Q3_9BACL|nr:hypothetical protein SAMN05421578_109169 [Paenibacillus macquariensis]
MQNTMLDYVGVHMKWAPLLWLLTFKYEHNDVYNG